MQLLVLVLALVPVLVRVPVLALVLVLDYTRARPDVQLENLYEI